MASPVSSPIQAPQASLQPTSITPQLSPQSQPQPQAQTLAIPASEDDPDIRAQYRPFLNGPTIDNADWISKLELRGVMDLVRATLGLDVASPSSETSSCVNGNEESQRQLQQQQQQQKQPRLKILVLYGSLRPRSFSKLLAYEAARILWRLGCDVRVFDPRGLPIKDDVEGGASEKVKELRGLSLWSDGHVWVSPEQHGNLTAVFKNQIDWIPLTSGSVRPTQGRTLAIAQVSGGSQSFNSVNSLRILGRWMRMFVIPNQSSVPMAWLKFSDEVVAVKKGEEERSKEEAEEERMEALRLEGGNRMLAGSLRDRLVDCMEELVKFTLVMRPHFEAFGDRYSERTERREKEEKEREKQKRKRRARRRSGRRKRSD